MNNNCADISRLTKLLEGLNVAELKFPEKCIPLVEEFRKKYGGVLVEADAEETEYNMEETVNPYTPNQAELEIINQKIQMLSDTQKLKKNTSLQSTASPDPKRPWRVNSCKEKLLRIDNELKRHNEKSSELIYPLRDDEITSKKRVQSVMWIKRG